MTSTARDSEMVPEIGKYHLVAGLARGGMGNVYLAVAQGPGGFNKLLALKELKPELAEDESYVTMFVEEARLAARLIHPNIVQTYEVGSDGRHHFMVMEYLDGRSLHRIVRKFVEQGGLSVGAQLGVIAESLRGLHYAHELRDFDGQALDIIHRDVSPLNVFVTFDGQVKVLDFGIAKAADSSVQTQTGVLKGRVAYMAPEQAWGAKVDRRADVYSAGVMLWEAAARRRLWPQMSDVEILSRVLRDPAPTLRSVRPDAPADLDAICARAMAKSAEERFPSCAALLDALEDHLATRDDTMSMREVGLLVDRSFNEERKKMNAVIEKMLTRMRGGPRSGVMPTFDAELGGGTTSDSHRAAEAQDASSASRHSVSHSVSSQRLRTPTSHMPPLGSNLPGPVARTAAPTSPPSDDGSPWWASKRVAIATLVGAAFASTFVLAASVHHGPAPGAMTPASAPTIVQAAAAAPAGQPELVEVAIRVSPASSLITVDGVAVADNPFRARYPRDARVHHVLASADGYEPKLEEVSFESDVSIDLSLEHHNAPAPHRAPAPAPPPPPPAAHPAKHAAAAPAPPPPSAAPSVAPDPTPSAAPPREAGPTPGQRPLRPIATSNPYGTP